MDTFPNVPILFPKWLKADVLGTLGADPADTQRKVRHVCCVQWWHDMCHSLLHYSM
jgi:hypothetical protein